MAIYSYLQGGLGNQMYQYAIARALSKHYQVNFALDCSWYGTLEEGVTPRKLDLSLLSIDQALFMKGEKLTTSKKLKFALQHYLPFGPIIQRQVNAFDFNQEIFHLKNLDRRDLYLFGYWQSFKYFNSIRSILQSDFTVRSPISDHYKKYQEEIQVTESVMMHIRRGDYVRSQSAASFHGALDLSYYLTAIKNILSTHKNAHFYVFSDDIDWAKLALPKNLKITFIDNLIAEESAVHELQLMTYCKHHIIANSSFSWWGAWLRKDDGGNIYAPNRWINDKSLNLSSLLPKNWIKLEA